MLLTVGKSYNISTVEKSIVKRKVKVVGYLNYDEALKVPYNIRTLAINEKIVTENNEDNTYLQNQQYYKCVILQSDNANIETSEYILVWDDVIDTNATTELNVSYDLNVVVSINPNADVQISEIMDSIKSHIVSDYSGSVDVNITINNVSSNVTIDTNTERLTNNMEQMKELLKESASSLLTLISLKNGSQTLLEKITNLNVSSNLTEMAQVLDEVKTTVDDIYSLVK